MPTVSGEPEWLKKALDEARRDGRLREGSVPPPAAGPKAPRKKPGSPEADFQKDVIGLAHLNGWRVAHFRRVRVQRASGKTYHETPVAADGKGFPDLILVRGKRLIAAELKAGDNTATAEQKAWLAALRAAGAETYIWYPIDWNPHIQKVLA